MSGRIPDQFVRHPVNFQTWEYLTFLHWSYDPATVQALLPDELTVQQWNGLTWVGITPFRMANVRAPLQLPIPGWGAFPELNVRAYVRHKDGRDGIWFLGMVVPRLSFMAAAGSLGLPYRRSHSAVSVVGSRWDYRFGTPVRLHLSQDSWFRATVQVGQPLDEVERTYCCAPGVPRALATPQRDGHRRSHRTTPLGWNVLPDRGPACARGAGGSYPARDSAPSRRHAVAMSGLVLFEQFRYQGGDAAAF